MPTDDNINKIEDPLIKPGLDCSMNWSIPTSTNIKR